MQWFPPTSTATTDRGGPQVIIDRSLALDLSGPLLTQRLSQECDIWVPASVWRALDESLISVLPILVASGTDSYPLHRPETERTVAIWERARILTGGRRLYWLAECRDDAHLPDWVTPESFTRFETLQEAIKDDCPDLDDEAGLDSVVLAAALQESAAAILCTCPGDGPPQVVAAAERLGATIAEVPEDHVAHVRGQWFGPLLMRAGLYEWTRMGKLPLAFVRLIAPDLLFLETETFNAKDRKAERIRDWPKSASLLWGRL